MSSGNVSYFKKWLLSSPPAEWALNQLREILIGALRQGPVPQHVAFVMDGNRRFAKTHRIETVEGHNLGFEALAKILEVCYKAGVKYITIYAFSIENFKRSKYEVDGLMEMAKVKLKQLVQHGDLLDRYGARVRILGQRELIKPDVLEAVDRAVAMTSGNGKCVLNICFPYTSREEITAAIKDTVSEYSTPIEQPMPPPHRRKSSFKEERIANTIRSQRLTDHNYKNKPHAESPLRQSMTYLQPPGPQSASSSTTSLSASSMTSHDSQPSRYTDAFTDADGELDHDSSSISTSSTLHSPPTATSPKQNPTITTSHDLPESSPSPIPSSSNNAIYPSPELITSQTLTEHMYTSSDPPIDLLVRTSGVSRLSDFMLWQCHEETQIVFLDVLWPEFDLWSFLPVLWEWQWRTRKTAEAEAEVEARRSEDGVRKITKAVRAD